MSRRRHDPLSGGSLELLLDTICNTFGGILFISLLVSLMVGERTTVEADQAASEAASAEMASLASQISLAQQELSELERSAVRAESLKKSFGNKVVESLIKRQEELRQETSQQQKTLSGEIAQANEELSDVNRMASDLQGARQKLADARLRLTQVTDRLNKAESKNKRVIGFPVNRTTFLSGVTVCIARSGACFLHKAEPFGIEFDPSATEGNRMLNEFGPVYPDYDKGLKSTGGELTPAILQKLRSFPEGRFFLQIWVEPDSVPLYHSLSDWASQRKIPIQVNAVTKKPGLMLSDRPQEVQ